MKVNKYIPPEALRPYIASFTFVNSENGIENNILPDTSVVLAFRYEGRVVQKGEELPPFTVTGLRKTSRLVEYEAGSSNLLVIFKPGGAAAFFRMPMMELFGQSMALDNLVPPGRLAGTEEQLMAADNDGQRVKVITALLYSLLQPDGPDQLVLHAAEQITALQGNIHIPDLLSGYHISRDPFEKRFRKVTGTSPKQFARIVRLRHLISTYRPGDSFTRAAYNAGYFDQAHFIKDFKLFTGQTPLRFFSHPPLW